MKHKMSEHSEQTALFRWANACKAQFPELGMMMAIPNGGRRDKITGARLKAEGVKAGVPDIFLAVPRYPFNGLFLEMKAGKNKPTPEQNTWAGRLAQAGYLVVVCHGWWEAKITIESYLDMTGRNHTQVDTASDSVSCVPVHRGARPSTKSGVLQ